MKKGKKGDRVEITGTEITPKKNSCSIEGLSQRNKGVGGARDRSNSRPRNKQGNCIHAHPPLPQQNNMTIGQKTLA